MAKAKTTTAFVCLECQSVYPTQVQCSEGHASSTTVSASTLAAIVHREWTRGALAYESNRELMA